MAIDNRGLTDADVLGFMDSLSNWGRWGPEDQAGALNYITPERRLRAFSLVQEAHVVSISQPLATTPGPENPRPVLHFMLGTGEGAGATGSMDFLGMAYHGMTISHIDALCHIFYRGKMYNGFPAAEVKPDGAHKNAIHQVLEKVVGRGVLLDIPAAKGKEWLDPAEPIYTEDLEAAERRQGVTVEPGDIVLVRTGRHKRARAQGSDGWQTQGLAGLHASTLPWLHRRQVAVLGSDGISDVMPSGFEGIRLPYHVVAIVAMGVHLLDNHDFERLAEACVQRGRYQFLFVLAPLFLERGTGSPANGLAIF
ncbi:MAG: cyclase family protein [Chloroflexi bacterium]|nr:cyclase family protein [Chloroflexota bacterium]